MDGKLLLLVLYCLLYVIEVQETVQGSLIHKCTKCSPGWGVARKCKKNLDTKCVECIEGRTYSPHRSSKSSCWSCSRCGIGLYESHPCSPVRDTICSECVSYLDHKNLTKNIEFQKKCRYLFLN